MSALLLTLALAAERPRVTSIAIEPDAQRPTLAITADAPLGPPAIARDGDTLTVSWDADLAPTVHAPPPSPPLLGIRLGAPDGRLRLELTVDPAVPHGVETEGERARVFFGAPPAPPADVRVLWEALFPAATEPAPLALPSPAEATPEAGHDDRGEGLWLGPVLVQPALEALYVSADSTFVSPRPVRDTYFELRPRVAARTEVGSGALTADYEARLRRDSQFVAVEQPSHLVNGALELPVGTRLVLRASEHYAHGTLETREVDPGGEYFFGLGRYTRNRFAARARLLTAGRLQADVGGAWENVDVSPLSSFFSYDRTTYDGRLDYELSPRLTASLGAGYETIPPSPERPIVESSARSAGLELKGELGPLTRLEAAAGVRDQTAPQVTGSGRRYRGLVLAARLIRMLGREASLQIEGARATFPSGFEDNAFYVASGGDAELTLPGPLALVVRLGAGYHWNDYRMPAATLGAPRRDRMWDGAVGLARPVTRHAWVRADYRRDRRDSNLDEFDVTTNAFTVQVGIGFVGAPAR